MVWRDGRPFTLTHEVLSPELEHFLGPMSAATSLRAVAAGQAGMANSIKSANLQVYFEAGSQLIAHFKEDMDHALAVRLATEIVEEDVGIDNIHIEVAMGCTVVYITFITFKMADQNSVHMMLGKLAMRATLTYAKGFEGQSGVLTLQREG